MNKVLVLGTADWSQQIATNQHYVVRELAREFDLIFVESMGLRTPELKIRDLRRITARLGRHTAKGIGTARRAIPPRVEVRSPLVLPRHVGLARRINQPRVHKLVSDWLAQPERILWTYSPVTYSLEERATAVVYHCVDLLGEVEGIPQDLIHRSERQLAQRQVRALSSSHVVSLHLREIGFTDVADWPNVADTEVVATERPSEQRRFPNRAVFAGNLSRNKVDFVLLERLISQGVDLHLAGPIAEGGGSAGREVEELVDQGAHYHGMLSQSELAALYWTAEIGLIPYLINDYTRGVSPLKTFEYLAAGLGVVSTPLPGVSPRVGHVVTLDPLEDWPSVVQRLEPTSDSKVVADRIDIAGQHSWRERGDAARRLVRQLSRRPGEA